MAAVTRFKTQLYYAGSFALTIGVTLGLSTLGLRGWAALIVYGAVMAAGFGAAIWAYQRIDEAAREAQKSAWFWGGVAGALVGMLLAMAMVLADSPVRALLPAGPPALNFFVGAVSVLVLQSVGFLVAWSVWWLAKR